MIIIINLNFLLHMSNKVQTIMGTVQSDLIDYYKKKIFKDIDRGVSKEEILKSLVFYRNYLVTEDILKIRLEDPLKYPNLNDSVEKFYKLEEEVKNYFKEIPSID